ncbi:MAG: protein kinase [Lachnospiraceae bacterium]|nr:protein kinase [Lachnospiraceae bacterium]
MVGKVVGYKYALLEKIGQGGKGSVYRARDLRLGKYWAVKALETGGKQEGEILKSLDHSMIPRVVDYLEEQGKLWLVMDYIEGKNLQQLHESGSLSRRGLLDLAIDLCSVLYYLHNLNPPYVYGDLKPENLVISQEGKLFLVDFGAGVGRYRGVCEGTPGYAAPEQAVGIISCLSDIYAFGRTWKYLLGGGVGVDWKRILDKCCQRSPRKRYQKIQELERCLKRMKRKREGRRLFFLLSGALAVCAVAGYSAGNKGNESLKKWEKSVEKKEGENGAILGKLAEALGQAARVQKKEERIRWLREVTVELEKFYQEGSGSCWKLRAGLLVAWAYREMEDRKRAGEVYKELLSLYPDSGECYGSYGCMLLEDGADEKCLQDLYEAGEQAVVNKQEYNYRIWVNRLNKRED